MAAEMPPDLARRLSSPALPCTAHQGATVPPAAAQDHLLHFLRGATVSMVRSDAPDLSARQLGVFLTVYLTDGPHTVRGLAAQLNVSKPAITRALDRLGELDLARRKVDPYDRRSVLVQSTLKGVAHKKRLAKALADASAS